MKFTLIIFYILATVSVISAFVTVTAKSTMRCALGLMFTMLGIAGIYVLMHAHLLAVLQILVYAGGVTVLMAFVILMMRQGESMRYPGPFMPVRVLSIITIFYLAYLIAPIYLEVKRIKPALSPDYGTVKLIASAIFSKHVIAFEAAGVLIFMTMIAVVAITGGMSGSLPPGEKPREGKKTND